MDIETLKKAADVTGCFRYWPLDNVRAIVETASSPNPPAPSEPSERFRALETAYWCDVAGVARPGSSQSALGKLFGKPRPPDIPQTREGIVAEFREGGIQAIWAVIAPTLLGQRSMPAEWDFQNAIIELGPFAVGLLIAVFKFGSIPSQQAFGLFSSVLLRRAKLLTPFIVSLLGEGVNAGERIALASARLDRSYNASVRALLESVEALPGYEAAAAAGLAKLAEYPEDDSAKRIYPDLKNQPREGEGDVVSEDYEVPGGVSSSPRKGR